MRKALLGALLLGIMVAGAASPSAAGVVLGLPDFTTHGTVSYNGATGIISSVQTPLTLTYDGVNFTPMINGNVTFSAQLLGTSSSSSLVTGYFGTMGTAAPDFSLTAFDGTQNYVLAGDFEFLNVSGVVGTNTGIAEAMIKLTNISANLAPLFDGRAGLLSLQFNIVPLFTANSFANDFSGSAKSDVASVPEPGTMVLLGTGLIGLACWGRRKARRG